MLSGSRMRHDGCASDPCLRTELEARCSGAGGHRGGAAEWDTSSGVESGIPGHGRKAAEFESANLARPINAPLQILQSSAFLIFPPWWQERHYSDVWPGERSGEPWFRGTGGKPEGSAAKHGRPKVRLKLSEKQVLGLQGVGLSRGIEAPSLAHVRGIILAECSPHAEIS